MALFAHPKGRHFHRSLGCKFTDSAYVPISYQASLRRGFDSCLACFPEFRESEFAPVGPHIVAELTAALENMADLFALESSEDSPSVLEARALIRRIRER